MEDLMLELYNNNTEIANIEEKISIAIKDLQAKQQELQTKNEEIKEKLKQAMEENEVKTYENAYIKLTYIAPTTRTSVDTTKLKENFKEVYNKCLKTSDVKSSLRIKVKEC